MFAADVKSHAGYGSIDMKNSIEQIEGLFRKADFSKETNLKRSLDRKLFAVRKVTLDELMKAEGMGDRNAKKDAPERSRTAAKSSRKQMDKENADVLERENPLVKKGKPPVL